MSQRHSRKILEKFILGKDQNISTIDIYRATLELIPESGQRRDINHGLLVRAANNGLDRKLGTNMMRDVMVKLAEFGRYQPLKEDGWRTAHIDDVMVVVDAFDRTGTFDNFYSHGGDTTSYLVNDLASINSNVSAEMLKRFFARYPDLSLHPRHFFMLFATLTKKQGEGTEVFRKFDEVLAELITPERLTRLAGLGYLEAALLDVAECKNYYSGRTLVKMFEAGAAQHLKEAGTVGETLQEMLEHYPNEYELITEMLFNDWLPEVDASFKVEAREGITGFYVDPDETGNGRLLAVKIGSSYYFGDDPLETVRESRSIDFSPERTPAPETPDANVPSALVVRADDLTRLAGRKVPLALA